MTNASNEVVTAVRELCAKRPTLHVEMQSGWGRICDKIEQRALAARPKPKVFEVHHETQTARLVFLTAIVAGRSVEMSEAEALEIVGLA